MGALFGAMGVLVFSLILGADVAKSTAVESKEAFKYVVWVSTGIVSIVGLLVWNFMKYDEKKEKDIVLEKISLAQVREVMRLPSVWLLMIIILCAYVGYKLTDIFSLYAQEIMLYDKVESAQVGTLLLFIRPVVGVVIGILADRSQTTLWLVVSFVVSFVGALLFAMGIVQSSTTLLFFLSTLTVAMGVYAARSLYFAVMQSGKIPLALTGTAVGMISLVGYTPDIFAGATMGYLLESAKGITGHRHVFRMLALFSLIGGAASMYYYRLYGKKNDSGI